MYTYYVYLFHYKYFLLSDLDNYFSKEMNFSKYIFFHYVFH